MIVREIPIKLFTDLAGYSFISNLYHSVSGQGDKELIVDFSACQKIDGNLAAALGAVLDKLLYEGYSIRFSTPIKKKSVKRSPEITFSELGKSRQTRKIERTILITRNSKVTIQNRLKDMLMKG